jgi:hypothetical protein
LLQFDRGSFRSLIHRPALGGGVTGLDVLSQVVEQDGDENSSDGSADVGKIGYASRLARSIPFERDVNPRLVQVLPECDTEQVLRNIGCETFRVAAIVLEFPFV